MISLPEGADARPTNDESLLARAVRRRAGDRQATAEDEVRSLLDVGLALMRENPTGEVRIADIVKQAEVSNDAFYRAFRGKADLMAAIADDGTRRLIGYVRHQVEKTTDPVERVRACVRAVLAQATDPDVAVTTRAVLRHVPRGTESRMVGAVEVEARIAELLVGPLGELGAAEAESDSLVASCALFGFMEHFLWSERRPTEEQAEHVVSWILAAVGAPG
jgi:AcrR family transcriptional regulator